MKNNTVVDNIGVNGPEAVHLHSGSDFGDGGIVNFSSNNDIFWNNDDSYKYDIAVIVSPDKKGSAIADINYSLIKSVNKNGAGQFTIANTYYFDPSFETTSDYPYQLMDDSPAIDAGNPTEIFNDNTRPPGKGTERSDLGAYGGPGNIFWP